MPAQTKTATGKRPTASAKKSEGGGAPRPKPVARAVKSKAARSPVPVKAPSKGPGKGAPVKAVAKGGKPVAGKSVVVKVAVKKVEVKSEAVRTPVVKSAVAKSAIAKPAQAKAPVARSVPVKAVEAKSVSKPATSHKPVVSAAVTSNVRSAVSTAPVRQLPPLRPVPVPAAVPLPPPPPPGQNTFASLGGADVAPHSSYGKALKFLSALSDFEHRRIVRYSPENFNLDRMRALLKRVGDPHTKFRSVHIAGTKGKGSTCAMVSAMVQANGYKTGLYTSPHLVDIRERIQIDGEMISREDFARLARTIEPHVGKIKPSPTYFDVLTAIAFMYFAEKKVELAVVEVGLGGRLDSTNVLTPEVSAITSISYDHMAQLGNTLEKIAAEKAGIFKPGVPAVVSQQAAESIEAVFRQSAEKVGAPFDVCGKTVEFSYRFESSRLAGPHFRLCLTTPQSKFEHLAVPMIGEHQAVNAGLALAIIDKLKTRGIAMSDARCVEGLARTYIPGRMELVSQSPRIIIDGAHNAASIDALMRSIGQHVPYDSMVLIFGCCGDKDVKGMLEKIASGADKVIFTRVNNIRTSEPEELAHRYTEQFGKMCQVAPTLEAALSIARRAVSKEDLIVITGSFYLVGEAKRQFPRVSPMTAVPLATSRNLAAAGAGA